jgi:hypothetical protein
MENYLIHDEYLPQDEHFEWEDISGFQSPTGIPPSIVADYSITIHSRRPSQYVEESNRDWNVGDWSWGDQNSSQNFTNSSGSQSSHHYAPTLPATSYVADCSRAPTYVFPTKSVPETQLSKKSSKLERDTTQDDAAVTKRPSRNVDYFSHNWQEDDLVASWRYIICNRPTLNTFSRLENIAWRSWTKIRSRLRTHVLESEEW